MKATVDGTIGGFEVIIKKPKAINDQYKKDIQNSLADLNKKLQSFINDYYTGSKLLASPVMHIPTHHLFCYSICIVTCFAYSVAWGHCECNAGNRATSLRLVEDALKN